MNEIYIPQFKLDNKHYKVGNLLKDEGKVLLEITDMKRENFPKRVVSTHANKLLNKGLIENFNCFYTGVECWMPNFEVGKLKVDDERVHYILSKDHAACLRVANELGLDLKGQWSKKIVMCSTYSNYHLGHIPLVLKLYLKKKLESCEYSRKEMTLENCRKILRYMVSYKMQFAKNGKFPWQPQTYIDKEESKSAQKIYEEMIQVDEKFLNIKSSQETIDFMNNYNASWIEKFIVNDYVRFEDLDIKKA